MRGSTPGGSAPPRLDQALADLLAREVDVGRLVKTAVTWEKPLRDSDRVYSSPGMPASAVSIGKVTCFSMSIGESAGATVLICTWLLVMSGTASIGSRASDQTPDGRRDQRQPARRASAGAPKRRECARS